MKTKKRRNNAERKRLVIKAKRRRGTLEAFAARNKVGPTSLWKGAKECGLTLDKVTKRRRPEAGKTKLTHDPMTSGPVAGANVGRLVQENSRLKAILFGNLHRFEANTIRNIVVAELPGVDSFIKDLIIKALQNGNGGDSKSDVPEYEIVAREV